MDYKKYWELLNKSQAAKRIQLLPAHNVSFRTTDAWSEGGFRDLSEFFDYDGTQPIPTQEQTILHPLNLSYSGLALTSPEREKIKPLAQKVRESYEMRRVVQGQLSLNGEKVDLVGLAVRGQDNMVAVQFDQIGQKVTQKVFQKFFKLEYLAKLCRPTNRQRSPLDDGDHLYKGPKSKVAFRLSQLKLLGLNCTVDGRFLNFNLLPAPHFQCGHLTFLGKPIPVDKKQQDLIFQQIHSFLNNMDFFPPNLKRLILQHLMLTR